MGRYAFFSISYRRNQARAADVSIEEWMNLKAEEGYRFLEHRQGIAATQNVDGPIIAVTIIMERLDI